MARLTSAHRQNKPRRSRIVVGAAVAAVIVGTTVPLAAFAATTPSSTVSANTTVGTTATLWGTAAPKNALVDSDPNSVELGTSFTASVPGTVVGVRYWKTAENTGTHVGNLWDSSGKRLATATFASGTTAGWQSVRFATPVKVAAGHRYVASYLAPAGHYASTENLVPPTPSSPLLSTPSASGVYSYGKTSSFPTSAWHGSGYWADVMFVPSSSTSAPATTAPSPTPSPTATTTATPAQSSSPAPTVTPTPIVSTPPTAPTTGTFGGPGNTGPQAAGFNPTTKYTGPMIITTPGTVITNQVIPAGLIVKAADVTIQGNIIQGPTDDASDQAAIEVDADRAKILDNVIGGTSASDWHSDPVSGVKLYSDSITFSRNNVSNIAGDGITLDGENLTITGNWLHDFVLRDEGVHYDGLHYPYPVSMKLQPALIQDNTVEMWIPVGVSSSGMTTALGLPEESGSGSQIVVNHNVIAGGGYAIEGGQAGTKVTNNEFWTKFSPNVGYYGIDTHMGPVTWTGNVLTNDGHTPAGTVNQ